MAITNGYAVLEDVKYRMGVPISDTSQDSQLESIIETASRDIERECGGRWFYAATQTRVYTPNDWMHLEVDDLLSVTSINFDYNGDLVYETTLASTDYYLAPPNAPYEAIPQPYSYVYLPWFAHYRYPVGLPFSVQIVGSWGFNSGASTACPRQIREATIRQAMRLRKRDEATLGITGSSEFGVSTVVAVDPDIKRLLDGFRIVRVG